MIYYNNNKIIKAYKGTSIVNKIDDYLSGSTPTPRLPQGYTEVEWVGSTSSRNSSFDTLITLGDTIGNTFSIEGKMWTVQQSGFGYLISNEWVNTPYPNFTWRWYNNTLNLDTPSGIEPDVELSLSDMGDGLSGFTISSDGLTLRNPKSVSFFCGNTNRDDNTRFTPWRLGYGKLYGDTKITKNGVLVSNLIPCKRDSDSRYGFYCSVRETFLGGTNLVGGDEVIPTGTTSETKAVFQYITDGSEPTSRLPQGYTEVEYVENTSNAYINTDFIPNQDTRIVAKMQCVTSNTSCCHFGANSWDENNGMWLTYETGISGTLHIAWLGKTTWTTYGNGDYNIHTYDWNKNVLYKDDVLVGSSTYGTYQCTNKLGIFTNLQNTDDRPNADTVFLKGRMYYFKVYDDGTLVRDFVPCINPNNVVGAYDVVNGVFYGSARSGKTFVAGNPI